MKDSLWEPERALWAEGYETLCGLDEAGRGPLAGPVAAGAVILPREIVIEGLNDSKKCTEKRREALYEEITQKAVAWAVGMASVEEIDRLNILNASMLAMRRAADGLTVTPDMLMVDGNIVRGFSLPARAYIGGDGKSASIAAASILAKVTRDRLMVELDAEYPGYGLARHKGYGTKAHREALKALGPSEIHRNIYLRKIEMPAPQPDRGEDIAAGYLADMGYEVLRRNYRTRHGVVDIIAARDGVLIMAEVKRRKNDRFAEAREAVDVRKQTRLRAAAAQFLAEERPDEPPVRFDVIEIYEGMTDNALRIHHSKNAF